jgi:hypothetical protein
MDIKTILEDVIQQINQEIPKPNKVKLCLDKQTNNKKMKLCVVEKDKKEDDPKEKPVEEKPVEDKPKGKRGRPAKEKPLEDKPKGKRGRPAKEKPLEDKPKGKRGRPAKEKPLEDKPKGKRGRPAKEKPIEDKPKGKRGRPAKEKPPKEPEETKEEVIVIKGSTKKTTPKFIPKEKKTKPIKPITKFKKEEKQKPKQETEKTKSEIEYYPFSFSVKTKQNIGNDAFNFSRDFKYKTIKTDEGYDFIFNNQRDLSTAIDLTMYVSDYKNSRLYKWSYNKVIKSKQEEPKPEPKPIKLIKIIKMKNREPKKKVQPEPPKAEPPKADEPDDPSQLTNKLLKELRDAKNKEDEIMDKDPSLKKLYLEYFKELHDVSRDERYKEIEQMIYTECGKKTKGTNWDCEEISYDINEYFGKSLKAFEEVLGRRKRELQNVKDFFEKNKAKYKGSNIPNKVELEKIYERLLRFFPNEDIMIVLRDFLKGKPAVKPAVKPAEAEADADLKNIVENWEDPYISTLLYQSETYRPFMEFIEKLIEKGKAISNSQLFFNTKYKELLNKLFEKYGLEKVDEVMTNIVKDLGGRSIKDLDTYYKNLNAINQKKMIEGKKKNKKIGGKIILYDVDIILYDVDKSKFYNIPRRFL